MIQKFSKSVMFLAPLALIALSACTEGRLSRKYSLDPITSRPLTPGRTIAAGGGISTGPGMQMRATLGETAGAPHRSCYPNCTTPTIQLKAGVQAVVSP